jgi:hypothetical protein
MSQNLNSVPPFDGMNYGYWKACMCFFLKSIDVWKIVEIGWIKPKIQTNLLLLKQAHDFPMIKPPMPYVKHFYHLNLQEFQIVKLLKMHGKF